MKKQDSGIKILISCHKPTEYISNNILTPIQLNCANKNSHFKDMLHDDEGDNISELNPMYCELTAQYWAWKNLDEDYYGFCHYRRYFNFSKTVYDEDEYGNIRESYPGKNAIKKYGLDEKTIENLVKKYDVIITEEKDVSEMPDHATSIIDQYDKAALLHPEDIRTILKVIDDLTPEYSESAHEFLNGTTTSFCNMYILKKDIFFRYAEWMFKILEEFCNRTDMSLYSEEALRTPGHLSERLFGIFLNKLRKENPSLKVKELQCVYFEKTDPQPPLTPAFKANSIPVVFAANNGFIPMFATCLQSLLEHTSPRYNYDIILIQSDVSWENADTLQKMVAPHKNVSLRLYDATQLLAGYELKANAHISVETYYRFLIQAAMPDYHKVLYLDCDTIINADVADLYNIDIDDYMLAAARDPDFLGQINGANKETMEYVKSDFKMKDPYNYFQAGVLLFNEDKMREAHSVDEWLTFASTPYRYNDQDVLNLYCEGNVKYLDMAWNMIVDHNHERVSKVIAFAPKAIMEEYRKAHAAPKIIHYAGFIKPWYRPTEDYAHIFWETARRTPYYEEVLQRMVQFAIDQLPPSIGIKGRMKNIVKRYGMKGFYFFFPYNSKRWRALRKVRGKDYTEL